MPYHQQIQMLLGASAVLFGDHGHTPRLIHPPGASISGPVGAIAQLGERLNGIQEVRGSTPLGSTIKSKA
jgi:hypothetical protein